MDNSLVELVKAAVSDFIVERPSLLELFVHEQSISHRIAVHLERRINNTQLHVDCEYNKNLGVPKLIEVDDIDRIARKACGCHVCADIADPMGRERSFRPDIIVHKRNSNGHNTVAIEVKKGKFCPFDEAKLKALTGSRNDYNYQLGVFVYFPKDKPEYIWYSKGMRFNQFS